MLPYYLITVIAVNHLYRFQIGTNLPQLRPSPLKGEDRRGMGVLRHQFRPIPTPPLEGKGEFY